MKNKDISSNFPFKMDGNVKYIKDNITRTNIIVGDFSYYDGDNFEDSVRCFYDLNERLIIGKFCQIAKGVTFIGDGANHEMSSVSTYPFFIFSGWDTTPPDNSAMPHKGDTVIGNDVWLGENVTILPGVHISDGAIIGMNSTVASDIPPYSIAVGNPCRVVKRRFNDRLIELLLSFKWWDKTNDEINRLIPLLTSPDLEMVENELEKRLQNG